MGKQTSVVQIEGSVGNLTFYKSKDGYCVRQKASSRSSNSDRTKENMQEFARAAVGAKYIRTAFASIIKEMKDSFLVRRLNQDMALIIKTDTVSPRGYRNLADADIEQLQGFEFNSDKTLSSVLKMPYTATIDRATGIMKVEIDSFIPSKLIENPEGATHFRYTIAGAMVNFENGDHVTAQNTSEELLLANVAGPALSMEVQLPAAGTAPLLLVFGISFSQEVNGLYYPVGQGLHNAIALVAISAS